MPMIDDIGKEEPTSATCCIRKLCSWTICKYTCCMCGDGLHATCVGSQLTTLSGINVLSDQAADLPALDVAHG
eukprot:587452-Hanusia_phi.AAC.9